jgi:hypothetical protein
MQTAEIIAIHPDVHGQVNSSLIDAIDAAYECADTCTSCADAWPTSEMVSPLT